MATQKLLVLDPGFSALRGHHYATALMLDAACKARNIDLAILGSLRIETAPEPGTFFCATDFCLKDVLYHPSRHAENAALAEAFLLHGQDLAHDLTTKATAYLTPETVILCHSANAIVMYGIAKWVKAMPEEMRPPVAINLQNHISSHEINEAIYTAALAQLAMFPNARIFGSNANICRLLQKFSGKDVKIFPLPFEYPTVPTTPGKTVPLFGLAGEVREEKKLEILEPAIAGYIERGGLGNFSLQAHFFLEKLPRTRSIHKQLLSLHERYPDRVALRLNPLYGEDYYGHIAGCDALLLPYPPEKYTGRVSQVLMDSIAMGVSPIVCKNSSMETDMRIYDTGGVCMNMHSPEALTAALFDFERNWKENKKCALEASGQFRTYHNKDTYLDVAFDVDNVFPFPRQAMADAYV